MRSDEQEVHIRTGQRPFELCCEKFAYYGPENWGRCCPGLAKSPRDRNRVPWLFGSRRHRHDCQSHLHSRWVHEYRGHATLSAEHCSHLLLSRWVGENVALSIEYSNFCVFTVAPLRWLDIFFTEKDFVAQMLYSRWFYEQIIDFHEVTIKNAFLSIRAYIKNWISSSPAWPYLRKIQKKVQIRTFSWYFSFFLFIDFANSPEPP